jgi:GAF domain-containing protein
MAALSADVLADLERENTRLSAELRALRDRQAGSAEILRTIASAPADAARSLQHIAETSARLFGAPSVSIQLAEDGEWGEAYGFGDSARSIRSAVPLAEIRVGGRNMPGRVISENRQIHIPDLDHLDPSLADFPGLPHARAAGTRTMCGTPLRRGHKAIGVLLVYRDQLLPFTKEELGLQQSFADQAVIAIENTRLFNETQEALERQTATADILKVIASSPTNVQPVFDVIVERAVRLCGAHMGRVYRFDGQLIQMVAGHGLSVPGRDKVQQVFPRPATDDTIVGQVMLSRRPYILADIRDEPSVPALSRQMIEALGTRSQVTMPMLLAREPIGAITVGWAEPRAYKDQQITLLQTFADQAVIAIENVRLFNETREALERQTATADILNVIASSPSDVQPVFKAIATSANKLIGGYSTAVLRFVSDEVHVAAFTPTNPTADDALKTSFPRPLADFPAFILVRDGQTVELTDTESQDVPRLLRDLARLRGYRSMLFTPLISSGTQLGLISVTRKDPGSFAAHHVQLVRTFADQAVIAIENVRLFDEVQERTRELQESLEYQTATADVLNVISRSTTNVQAAFDAIAMSAARLFEPCETTLCTVHDGQLHWRATASLGRPVEAIDRVRSIYPLPFDPENSPSSRAIQERRIIEIADAMSPDTPENTRRAQSAGEFRSITFVPLLRDGIGIGTIILTHPEAGFKLSPKQLALVQTFADQAVIAIENARLFDELQERTKELSRSLDDLRTAQDRLVQTEKLASLGQLTAGIAHEIKNPLNFVNNFSAMSAELTGELNEALKSASLSSKLREEVDELTRMLKDNLEKVVQHGKRADSIVKNMLLHSRQGSGEHRPADINALLDDSLNLAYHGARAEKPQFHVTLRREFDQTAGTLELFPQEITRVFLNLISNGFYALTKRKTDNGEVPFEPVLSAATRNLGDSVEIRIRDNGTGIPADVKEKMFNPFFTTKPAGEGTGLGLSMSYDIIVKQHGGKIDVETQAGQFTEFRIVLPRARGLSQL